MSRLLTIALALAPAPAPDAADPRDVLVATRLEVPQPAPTPPRRRYLTREVAPSARHLDHGVLGVAAGFGLPHVYRLELGLGLLDHLTLGATAHWLPRQNRPGWSPKVALAVFRGRFLEVGATYHQLLHRPPQTTDDSAAMGFAFVPRTHYTMAHVSLSQAWFTGGLDLGWARGREGLQFLTVEDVESGRTYSVRNRIAGGIHLRAGTRRFGVLAQVLFPYPSAELVLDVRFGLFERRPRGGWSPRSR